MQKKALRSTSFVILQKTITILLPDLRSGGAERVNIELAKIFQQRGHLVEFVLRNARGELLEQASKIGRIVDLNAPRVRNAVKPFAAYIKKRRPDGVLASMWPLTTVAVRARDMSGHNCSLVLCEHGILSQQYAGWGLLHGVLLRLSLRYASKRADHVVGVSRGVTLDLSRLSGRDPRYFTTIYNPVLTFSKSSHAEFIAANALWSAPQGQRIITVGRLKEVKNHRLLIDAFALLPNRQTELMIVGDGELRTDLERHATRIGVGERVVFAGFQPDPTPFYQSADLFVMSSLREGFGNVLVEAMSQGLPVVSTDCPSGPREILEDEKYGLLTSVGDVWGLADAMKKSLSAPVDANSQRTRAAMFRPEIAANSYLKLLLDN